jgi:hypothetical protein
MGEFKYDKAFVTLYLHPDTSIETISVTLDSNDGAFNLEFNLEDFIFGVYGCDSPEGDYYDMNTTFTRKEEE